MSPGKGLQQDTALRRITELDGRQTQQKVACTSEKARRLHKCSKGRTEKRRQGQLHPQHMLSPQSKPNSYTERDFPWTSISSNFQILWIEYISHRKKTCLKETSLFLQHLFKVEGWLGISLPHKTLCHIVPSSIRPGSGSFPTVLANIRSSEHTPETDSTL